jgi:subtilisin family serine protease
MLQPAAAHSRAGEPVPGSYIVTLKASPQLREPGAVASTAHELASRFKGQLGSVYTAALRGFSVHLPADRARALAKDPRVASVEQDVLVAATSTQLNPSWSLDRIDQTNPLPSGTYDYDTDAHNVNIYVLDTGVRATHAEFGGRVKNGPPPTDDNDCAGHGTAVAGAAAGATWGVAKNATIYSVRVLGCTGVGPATSALDAIDWVTTSAPRPAVVNISWLTGPQDALDQAIRNSIASGITYVISAGNGNVDACTSSPSRVREAIVVGGTDRNDVRVGSYGSCVDLFAPSTDITTASFASDTATMTAGGTSLSAPIVAGAAALYLANHPAATPQQVSDALDACADTGLLGNPGPQSPDRIVNTRCDAGPLTITNPGRQQTSMGVPVRITKVKATDSSGMTVRYGATGLPTGVSIDATTGVISGTPSSGGTTTVKITATDQDGASTFTTFVWEVDLGYGFITGINGLCVDNNSSRSTDGNPIQLWQCQQVWAARADGTIVIQGKCLTASTQTSANGLLVVLSTCVSADSQVWRAQADGTLRNPASGSCLTAPQAGLGVWLTLAGCNGAAGQQWQLPSGARPDVISVNSPGTQVTFKGTDVRMRINANSTDTTQALTYAATGLPPGLSINTTTGMISGQTNTPSAQTVTITATDGGGVSGSASFLWQVANGPIPGLNGLCLDDYGSRTTSGVPVQMSICGNWGSQQWFVRADNRLVTTGMCMAASGGGTSAGTAIVLESCGTAGSEVWQPQPDGTLRNPVSGLCLTVLDWEVNSQLALATCAALPTQDWALPTAAVSVAHPGRQEFRLGTAVSIATAASTKTLTYRATGLPAGLSINAATGLITGAPTAVSDGTAAVTATDANGDVGRAFFDWGVHDGLITNLSGRCVDNYLGVTPNGNPIVVWGCNSGNTQLWTVRANGALSVEGKCLTVAGDSTADGSPIVLYDCRDVGAQIWRQQANGSLVNPASGKCLNAPSLASGTQFTLAACTDAAGQHWLLPFVVTNPGPQSTDIGTTVNLPIVVTTVGGRTLAYSATGLPAGLSIDPAKGVITGAPTAAGTTTVTVTLTDGSSTSSMSFSWQVSPTTGTPPPPPPQTTVQINSGGAAAAPFAADTDFTGGTTVTTTKAVDTSAVSNPAPQAVYLSNRYGNFTYTIPGLTAGGTYHVRLHFAETYWTTAGARTFNVVINGQQVLTNFDMLAAAGAANKAVTEQFTATADGTGKITIQFVTTKDNAQVNGIEISS